jgi:hypothetical protein
MCPVCLATAAIIAGSATGTGGLTALVARTMRRKIRENPVPATTNKENQDGHEPDRSSSPQDRLPRGMD